MAKALLRKEVGDTAIVKTPKGDINWKITNIEYIK